MLFRAQSSGCKENKRHPVIMVAVGMAVKSGCTGRVLLFSITCKSLWLMDESSGQIHSKH